MPEATEHFVCPCCGMHAPVDRVFAVEPFPLQMFVKTLGGKQKLSDAAREERKGRAGGPGSASGSLSYDEIEVTDELRELVRARVEIILEGGL